MSTYMLKTKDVNRKWYIIDAAYKPLGRVAVEAARLLKGKHKPDYTPHVDCGDNVIILNAEKITLTGKKTEKKYYRYHTGWVGGLKEIQYKALMAIKPEKALALAIKGMLPANSIGKKAIARVKIYKGEKHCHEAQKPVEWTCKYCFRNQEK